MGIGLSLCVLYFVIGVFLLAKGAALSFVFARHRLVEPTAQRVFSAIFFWPVGIVGNIILTTGPSALLEALPKRKYNDITGKERTFDPLKESKKLFQGFRLFTDFLVVFLSVLFFPS